MNAIMLFDIFADMLFIFILILNGLYVKKLEDDIDALKSWIEFFWKIDFGAMADAVEKHRKDKTDETDRRR